MLFNPSNILSLPFAVNIELSRPVFSLFTLLISSVNPLAVPFTFSNKEEAVIGKPNKSSLSNLRRVTIILSIVRIAVEAAWYWASADFTSTSKPASLGVVEVFMFPPICVTWASGCIL